MPKKKRIKSKKTKKPMKHLVGDEIKHASKEFTNLNRQTPREQIIESYSHKACPQVFYERKLISRQQFAENARKWLAKCNFSYSSRVNNEGLTIALPRCWLIHSSC